MSIKAHCLFSVCCESTIPSVKKHYTPQVILSNKTTRYILFYRIPAEFKTRNEVASIKKPRNYVTFNAIVTQTRRNIKSVTFLAVSHINLLLYGNKDRVMSVHFNFLPNTETRRIILKYTKKNTRAISCTSYCRRIHQ